MKKRNPIVILAIAFIFAIISFAGCKSNDAEITEFKIGDQAGVVNSADQGSNVRITVPYGTPLDKVAPTITISPKATISPESGVPVDLSDKSGAYEVTAEDGKVKKTWTVYVTVAPNTAAEIESFDFPGLASVNIGGNAADGSTVVAIARYGIDPKGLVPTIFLSGGATIVPSSGEKQDFSNPVVYKVTAQDGTTTKDWTINVSVAEPAKTITITYAEFNDYEAMVDTTVHAIRVQLPDKEKLDAVVVTELIGTFGKVEPKLAVGDTLNFSNGAKTFTFSVQDTTVKATEKWTIAVFHSMVTDLEKAVIGKREGVEHALARQVALNPVFWGYTKALSDSAALKEWIGRKAHQIADSTGYVGYETSKEDTLKVGCETGKKVRVKKEVRVKNVGVLYVLGKNKEDRITVTEYEKMPAVDTKPTDINFTVAPEMIKFAGADKETAKFHVQGYEYIFTPSTCSPPCPPDDVPQITLVSFNDLPDMPIFPADE